MNNIFSIFVRPSDHSIYIYIDILTAFAFLVIFNGSVKAFSFPEGDLFTYQDKNHIPIPSEIGTWIISHTQERLTYGVDQPVEFFPFVSINSKPIADKIPNKSTYDGKCNAFYKAHNRLITNIVCFLFGFTLMIFLRYILSYLR